MNTDIETIAGVVVLVGTASCVLSLVVLHLLPTRLSALHSAVSQYGITPYHVGYRVQTISMGIAGIAAAIGIHEIDITGGTLVVLLLALFGGARLVISWSPMDAPGAARSVVGRRHGTLAMVAFGCSTIAALRFGGILTDHDLWGTSARTIFVLGIVMLVTLIAMGAVRRNPSGRSYFGLVERAFYFGVIAFLAVAGEELIAAH